ncbi:hypothetical protein [Bdellovibrio sp. NC01]|uniref:hypothetical protein n=1 Tax=Bdellovibrio sp. NC01 TaxID=2220073 RepID=UPI001158A40B|nr:hypothetical protein [Bdellovibrio sp. NC01]QDK39527.1 hypothetical protein DOE51_18945 [Bdellovibrio sp. NC01]
MKLLIFSLVSIFASASFAQGHIVCKNEGFTKLAIDFQVQGQSLKATVLAANSDGDEYMPKVGDKAVLNLDKEASKADWAIFRTTDGIDSRGYSLNVKKADLAAGGTFRGVVGTSTEYSDLTWASYEMSCTVR